MYLVLHYKIRFYSWSRYIKCILRINIDIHPIKILFYFYFWLFTNSLIGFWWIFQKTHWYWIQYKLTYVCGLHKNTQLANIQLIPLLWPTTSSHLFKFLFKCYSFLIAQKLLCEWLPYYRLSLRYVGWKAYNIYFMKIGMLYP